jgi:acyl-CoA thioester hydrolase
MKIRVYYEDTDCGNVVYYANYLKYMERSRTEYLRERGIELKEFHKNGVIFAVSHVNVKYRQPARYNDLLTVESSITELASFAMTFETTIHNGNGTLLTSGTVKVVCVSADNGKACKIPEEILEALK